MKFYQAIETRGIFYKVGVAHKISRCSLKHPPTVNPSIVNPLGPLYYRSIVEEWFNVIYHSDSFVLFNTWEHSQGNIKHLH